MLKLGSSWKCAPSTASRNGPWLNSRNRPPVSYLIHGLLSWVNYIASLTFPHRPAKPQWITGEAAVVLWWSPVREHQPWGGLKSLPEQSQAQQATVGLF